MPHDEGSLEERAIVTWAKRRLLPRPAAKAMLSATANLTLCMVAVFARLQERGQASRLVAENGRLRLENAERRSLNDILRSRLDRIPARERPHYTPEVRFQILEHMRRFLLSVEEAAHRVLVTPQTLYNWLRELDLHPDAKTIGALLRASPPITRYANVVRRLARQMKQAGFRGQREIAMTLARIGWSPSRRSVGRFCKERPRTPDPSPPSCVKGKPTTVYGRHPNHLWLADVTRVPLLFPFLHLHLTVVLDAFSRLPLATALSYFEPTAGAMLALVDRAIRVHGRPRHFVSDQGSQFTAEAFRAALRALGIRQRFGALYQHGSIALIERFFLTLKTDLRVDRRKPWGLDDLERRLVPALVRYSFCRPHSALAGRVPVEAFFGIRDQRPLRNLAPRGRPSDAEIHCPLEVALLDPDSEALPILIPTAA